MPHISYGSLTAQRAEGASVQALDLAVAALVVRGEGETLSTVSAQPRAAVEGHCVREGGREVEEVWWCMCEVGRPTCSIVWVVDGEVVLGPKYI